MMLSRIKSLWPARFTRPQPMRRRDGAPLHKKSDVSAFRLVGYFAGGILLTNFVLMTSAAFRGHAAQPPQSSHLNTAQKRGPAAALEAEAQTAASGESHIGEPTDTAILDTPKPALAALCVEQAREKLMAGLTHYYLQRGLHGGGTSEAVSESATMTALLAGPAEPAVVPGGKACAG